jgi:hypothetical protein
VAGQLEVPQPVVTSCRKRSLPTPPGVSALRRAVDAATPAADAGPRPVLPQVDAGMPAAFRPVLAHKSPALAAVPVFAAHKSPALAAAARPSEAPQDTALLRGNKLLGAKTAREEENAAAVGGLRNPNKAVAKSKKLQEVGRRARAVFEKLGEDQNYRSGVVTAANKLGDKSADGFPKEIIQKLKDGLRKEFGAKEPAKNTVFDYELWSAMLQAADDVEVDVPNWLRDGCPTGIGTSEIPARGVFPAINTASASVMSSKEYAKSQAVFDWRFDRHKNYKSFYTDDGRIAKAEVDRIADKGFVDVFATWEEVIKRWPNAKASKVLANVPPKTEFQFKNWVKLQALRLAPPRTLSSRAWSDTNIVRNAFQTLNRGRIFLAPAGLRIGQM